MNRYHSVFSLPFAAASSERRSALAHSPTKRSRWLGALVILLGASGAHAATYCANSVQTLQVAFALGEISQSAFTIQVAKGDYAIGGISVAFSAPTTIQGGYNGDCSARVGPVNAAETVIDFSGGGVGLYQQSASPRALIAMDGLTMQNADHYYFQSGQSVTTGADDDGDIKLTRTRLGSVGISANASQMVTFGDGGISLENVQFDSMATKIVADDCSIALEPWDGGNIYLSHVSADLAPNKDFCLGIGGNANSGTLANIYNSIFYSSSGQSSTLRSLNSVDTLNVVNSIYFALVRNGANGVTSGNLQVDPMWVNAPFYDYHLSPASAAVNSATPIPPGGLPSTDIEGNARWIGGLPDRGAYESAFNNASEFLVTSTSDSNVAGSGSLRDAINQANSLPNSATIKFAIPGACPHVIALASKLPSITSPIKIDGTTQAGSSINTADDAFNATLCVVVKPAGSSLATGFAVASGADQASLTLRGIALGGFGQAVTLFGGSNHVIAGNQFGGTVGGVALPGAGLYAISIGVNATGSLIVGGNSLADRNVIGGAAFAGVNIASSVLSDTAHCQIVNNLIGLGPTGNSALPNFTGINLSGSGCSVFGNRIAGNTNDALWINTGNDNVIQSNIIGIAVNGNAFVNSGAGIRISGINGNGSGNVIGSSATSSINSLLVSNTIMDMLDGGVIVEGGSNNSIRSNLIHDNGLSGAALDIDLASDGPTPNDLNDPDAGANKLQNFPLTANIIYTGAPAPLAKNVKATLSGTLNAASGGYRIDAYFSNRCDSAVNGNPGRGHSDAYIGTRIVNILVGTNATFTLPVSLPNILNTGVVSLTATDTMGNTSELGSCYWLINAKNDTIFADGFGS